VLLSVCLVWFGLVLAVLGFEFRSLCLLGRPSDDLNHASISFCSAYLGDRVLHCAQVSLDCDLSTLGFPPHHQDDRQPQHPWLFSIEMKSLKVFVVVFPRLAWNLNPPTISYSQVFRITGVSHQCLALVCF
jgi:hypothetical protein